MEKTKVTHDGQIPTVRQRKAAKKLKEVLESNQVLEGNEILTISGYSAAIAKNPKIVFESKGFKKALKDLGFSLDAADLTVAKILRTGKEENQLKASDQIYKRLGGYKQGESPILTISQLLILINGGTKEAKGQELESK